MTVQIPAPAIDYTAPLNVFNSNAFNLPAEGRKIVPVEIDWDGTNKTVRVNVQGIAAAKFSQITMLDVDNTSSGADVTFFFPDTQDTLVVPSGTAGLFPVFTNQLNILAFAAASIAGDTTRFRVLNYLQPPVENPAPEFHNFAASAGIAFAAGTTHVIPITTSGTLVAYSANVGILAGAGGFVGSLALVDHASGNVIDAMVFDLPANAALNQQVMNCNNIAIRFTQGIDAVIAITAGAVGGNFVPSLKFREP